MEGEFLWKCVKPRERMKTKGKGDFQKEMMG